MIAAAALPKSGGGRSGASIGPVEWFLAAAGVGLVVAAVLDVSPIAAFRAAIAGESPPARGYYSSRVGAGTVSTGADPTDGAQGFGSSTEGGGRVPPLTTFRNPSNVQGDYAGDEMKLTPTAYAAYRRWEALFGRPLVISSGYRSWESQERSKREAEARGERGRFADPDKSWHVKGKAVDLDLAAIGAAGGPGTPTYDRLRSTGQAAGWCFPRAAPQGDGKEPWHASHGGCG